MVSAASAFVSDSLPNSTFRFVFVSGKCGPPWCTGEHSVHGVSEYGMSGSGVQDIVIVQVYPPTRCGTILLVDSLCFIVAAVVSSRQKAVMAIQHPPRRAKALTDKPRAPYEKHTDTYSWLLLKTKTMKSCYKDAVHLSITAPWGRAATSTHPLPPTCS